MRVSVDPDRCVGSGNCENAASAVFRLGDDGLAVVTDPRPGPDLTRRVRGAVLGCPTGAIRFEEDGDDDEA